MKGNSIQGSKVSSVKVVYCNFTNLRKDLVGMDVGTVGFVDSKLCRYRRVNKDRSILNRIEKTKREVSWDYANVKEQWELNERTRRKMETKESRKASGIENVDVVADATMMDHERRRKRAELKGQGSGIGELSQETIAYYIHISSH